MRGRLLIRDACLADGQAPTLQVGISLLIENGRIARVSVDELDPGDAEVLDGGGATIVPAFVDAHSHLTMPGGSHWIERGSDQPDRLREVVHTRGRKITAHATILDGARVGAQAGVDSIEHGMELDDATAATMRANNVALVSTLSVLASWATFERTTRIERFTSEEGKRRLAARREGAFAAIKAAQRAGVRIAAGSDFGGGSVRAGHLAWEVEQLVLAGLEPHQALAAVTWRGGELLGIDHAGRIRQGDPADLVLVHGDPLSDARALWRVWGVFQGGERIA